MFEFKPEKMASAIAYFLQRSPLLTKKQICKLLYFADKRHLLTHGRTITGDTYKALDQGHVPSNGLNMMNSDAAWIGNAEIECLRRYCTLEGTRRFVRTGDPDMKVFSKSDRSALESVFNELGHLSAHQLENLSHLEPSWILTPRNRTIAIDLFFEGHPEHSDVREALLEEIDSRVA